MDDYPLIRAEHICPNCHRPKDVGLILCWPCHQIQKARNDGGYSQRLERQLERLERHIASELLQ